MADLPSRDNRHRAPVMLARRVCSWMIMWIVLMALWVIVDDSIGLDELLAGAGAAALGSIFVAVAAHQAAIRPAFRPSWLVPALRLPARVARETVVVFAALIRRLATGTEPRSGFVAESVQDQPDGIVARTLLIGFESVAPNQFALGIDEAGVMVSHKLMLDEGDPAQ
ncbi:MAG TPA: hypothetical protein VJT16_00300 [Streptosporangiaceae bacterium]|jgi:multisubunit Na+/H+ antiporter MnhE subunit|nr:hypothetical protein [Streptosporangiaceae bacterium]